MTTILELIAKRKLGIQTLEARHSDSLDFHDCAVWRIREALDEAFCLGFFMGLFGIIDGACNDNHQDV